MPVLPFEEIPHTVAKVHQGRNNLEATLRRCREDPYWLCHAVLAQKGALQVRRYREDDCWIVLKQGSALLISEGILETPEDRSSFDNNPTNFQHQEGRPVYLALQVGDMMVMPALSVFSIFYLEDSLMSMGNILPRNHPNSDRNEGTGRTG